MASELRPRNEYNGGKYVTGLPDISPIIERAVTDLKVWLVFVDQGPADVILAHVASTRQRAQDWVDGPHTPHSPPRDAYFIRARGVDDVGDMDYA